MIEVRFVGGYSEVGRNMTAVRYKDDVVILDMGVHLERYIKFKGDDDLEVFSVKELIKAKAVPDDSIIREWKKDVAAIIPSHAHLDHIGAIPYMAKKYDAPIICTPYTGAVIKAILNDKKINIPNEIRSYPCGKIIKLSDAMSVEFVNITHSVPDTAIVLIHTPEGTIAYANDFKLDDTPVMGEKPDYKRLKELGDSGKVLLLIMDSLYSDVPGKTPSESHAKEMLKIEMLNPNLIGKGVIVTTFSSHISRLKSIAQFGKAMKRKIVFLGRSLAKYVNAADSIGLADFSKNVEIVPYKNMIARKLKMIDAEGRENYLIVSTGHQGEPDAVLSRIASGRLRFDLREKDAVIFSCNVIPSSINVENRNALEEKISKKGAMIIKGVHQSGHGALEDQKELIRLLSPKNIVPAHSGKERAAKLADASEGLGYKKGKTAHVVDDGDLLSF